MKQRSRQFLHWTYLLRYWASTLLIAPVVAQSFIQLTSTHTHQVVGLIEVYPITFIVSLILSFPTYLIAAIVDWMLIKKRIELKLHKYILVAIAVGGVFSTFDLFFKNNDLAITMGYALSSLFFGLMYKLK